MILFKRKYSRPAAWSISGEDDLKGEVSLELIFGWPWVFSFLVRVPNKSFSYRNPLEALGLALESEALGNAKYQALKERTRARGLWQKL